MKDVEIEPGLLQTFRLFMTVMLGLELMRALTFGAHTSALSRPIESVLAVLAITVLLLAYLSLPQLPRQLGPIYLPLGLLTAALIPIVGQYLTLRNQAALGFGEFGEYAWQQMLLLIFPLLLISWQYRFRWVVVFSLGTGLADLALVMLTISRAELEGTQYLRVLFMRVFVYLAVGYLITRLVSAQRQQRQALREANVKLTHYAATLERLTITRERNRLARELHDTLAHTLSGLAVQLEAVKALWQSDVGKAYSILETSLEATRSGLAETRQAIQSLRASPLEDLGLLLALRNLAESAASRAGFSVSVELPPTLERLSPDVEHCFFRVAQEALENIVRHAEARSVNVQLTQADGFFALTICDDGRGFRTDQVDAGKHFGIQNMRERAEMIGGNLEVSSQPGQGTRVRLWVRQDDGTSVDL